MRYRFAGLAVFAALAALPLAQAQPCGGQTGLEGRAGSVPGSDDPETEEGSASNVEILPRNQMGLPTSVILEVSGRLESVYSPPGGWIFAAWGNWTGYQQAVARITDHVSITARFQTPGKVRDIVTPKFVFESMGSMINRHESVCTYAEVALGWVEINAPTVSVAAGPGQTNTITETIWKPAGDGGIRTRTLTAAGPSYLKPGQLDRELEELISYYVQRGWNVGQPPPQQ